jgi:hypothetical protein
MQAITDTCRRTRSSDRIIVALDIAGLAQALMERARPTHVEVRAKNCRGILSPASSAAVRAVRGHAPAAPPSNDMNSRRLMGSLPCRPVEQVETITGSLCCASQQNRAPHFRIGSKPEITASQH